MKQVASTQLLSNIWLDGLSQLQRKVHNLQALESLCYLQKYWMKMSHYAIASNVNITLKAAVTTECGIIGKRRCIVLHLPFIDSSLDIKTWGRYKTASYYARNTHVIIFKKVCMHFFSHWNKEINSNLNSHSVWRPGPVASLPLLLPLWMLKTELS